MSAVGCHKTALRRCLKSPLENGNRFFKHPLHLKSAGTKISALFKEKYLLRNPEQQFLFIGAIL